MMKKIGITGGIGSGKSVVCRLFHVLGIPVFNADDAAKSVMVQDQILIEGIKTYFGAESYFEDGSLNRGFLASVVFADEEKLQKLNELVHPATFRAYDEWVLQQKAPYVVKEAALMFESGANQRNDINIVVLAPESLRLQRAMQRDRFTEEQIRSRMEKQWPQEKLMSLADYSIVNDETELLIPQVLQLDQLFRGE